ncbi:protein of unknown function [uncultured Woeseiaceae bacterium]|uniref:Uncharacterized protein n=1 Tax=uncultured Woeseiaceae bacterium TaxID=1983305 RepID=A0A7D9D2G5_9GAMM|nr:protein of unknown function [uncultured Woeseiaceae bacterium]
MSARRQNELKKIRRLSDSASFDVDLRKDDFRLRGGPALILSRKLAAALRRLLICDSLDWERNRQLVAFSIANARRLRQIG